MKLLFVNCCISQRGTGSRTHALAEAFLTAFQASHPGWETEEVTPETLLALKPFDPEMLDRRDTLAKAGDFGAPVYDLGNGRGDAGDPVGPEALRPGDAGPAGYPGQGR